MRQFPTVAVELSIVRQPPSFNQLIMTDKHQQRQEAYCARNAQKNKDQLSKIICKKIVTHRSYQNAETVMWYLHCRSEVRTINAMKNELMGTKKIVIPFCTKDENQQNKLGLWLLNDLAELVPGMWGILEPPQERQGDVRKVILPQELDCVIVPGVAFDCNGGRLGNGAGYYDRLLQDVRADATFIAVCYESQMYDKVVMEKHDVVMDCVMTENNTYCSNQ